MKEESPFFLGIKPFIKAVKGEIFLPGSKSMTNRALLLSSLCNGKVTLKNALFSEDTEIMLKALRALGFNCTASSKERIIVVQGEGGKVPKNEASIYVGNAGTVARFLTAFLCLSPAGTYFLESSEAMQKRPIKGLLSVLEKLGAASVQYHGKDGYFPFTLKTHGFNGGTAQVDTSASSQILSALLLIGPFALKPFKLFIKEGKVISAPFIQMTLKMMAQFGFKEIEPLLEWEKSHMFSFEAFKENPYSLDEGFYHVESDATAASYFGALTLVTRSCFHLKGLPTASLQGDIAFLDILTDFGLKYQKQPNDYILSYDESFAQKATERSYNFNAISDTFLTLAAIAPLLGIPITMTDIAHTRHQETDRIRAMAEGLEQLGQRVTTSQESLSITPRPLKTNGEIATHKDHRVAMSFGVLGCYDRHKNGAPWLFIEDPFCCSKTYPQFFNELEALRKLWS